MIRARLFSIHSTALMTIKSPWRANKTLPPPLLDHPGAQNSAWKRKSHRVTMSSRGKARSMGAECMFTARISPCRAERQVSPSLALPHSHTLGSSGEKKHEYGKAKDFNTQPRSREYHTSLLLIPSVDTRSFQRRIRRRYARCRTRPSSQVCALQTLHKLKFPLWLSPSNFSF